MVDLLLELWMILAALGLGFELAEPLRRRWCAEGMGIFLEPRPERPQRSQESEDVRAAGSEVMRPRS